MKKIRLAFFTSTRGDLAILKPLIDSIKKNKNFNYLFFVHGTHLEKSYGYTIKEVEQLKIRISAKGKTLSKIDNKLGIIETLQKTQIFMNKIFNKFKFDAVIILGDRIERLPIISNSIAYRKLIFHLHGGELTYGSYDDQVRHIITKASHLHFPICESYKKNILKLSEERFRICNSGSLAVENILKYLQKNKYKKKKYVILTYHPETITDSFQWESNFKMISETLSKFEFKVIVTAPGHEKGSQEYIKSLKKIINKFKNFTFIPSLGYEKYFKILNETKFVIGNSSSGIIEVPYFKIPTINIGDRQHGRFNHDSIISCQVAKKDLNISIKKAISSKFNYKISKMKLYFGKGNASKKILNFIYKNINHNNKLIHKKFK